MYTSYTSKEWIDTSLANLKQPSWPGENKLLAGKMNLCEPCVVCSGNYETIFLKPHHISITKFVLADVITALVAVPTNPSCSWCRGIREQGTVSLYTGFPFQSLTGLHSQQTLEQPTGIGRTPPLLRRSFAALQLDLLRGSICFNQKANYVKLTYLRMEYICHALSCWRSIFFSLSRCLDKRDVVLMATQFPFTNACTVFAKWKGSLTTQ